MNTEEQRAEHAAYMRDWRRRNPERYAAGLKRCGERHVENREARLEKQREWKKKNPQWRSQNREANRERDRAWVRQRKAVLRRATPRWVDAGELRALSLEAKRRSLETGIKYSTDHIVPLQHPEVSGLNVPWNVRVVPLAENIAKHNRFEPKWETNR